MDAYKKSFSGLRARERMLRVKPVADGLVVAELEKAEKKSKAVMKKAVAKKAAKKASAKAASEDAKRSLNSKRKAAETPVTSKVIKKTSRRAVKS